MQQAFSEEVFVMVGIVTFIIVILVLILLFAFITNQKRKFLYRKKIGDLHNSFTREILTSRIEMKEETLKAVASELHDNVGHMISIGLMHLNLLPQATQEADETKLQEARLQLNKAIDGLRDISKAMNSDVLLQNGLAAAIDQQLNRLRKSAFYQVDFTRSGPEPVLKDEQHGLIIFRIIQESITNIIRHSKARQIRIDFMNDEKELQITILDNGTGFAVKETLEDKEKGSGLSNIFKRAGLIGASINIDSTPKGTTIILHYPLI